MLIGQSYMICLKCKTMTSIMVRSKVLCFYLSEQYKFAIQVPASSESTIQNYKIRIRSMPVLKCYCNISLYKENFSLFSRGRIELGDVTVHNLKQLKRLNQVVFPVTYNDKFYKDVLEVGELAKLGKWKMTLVIKSDFTINQYLL